MSAARRTQDFAFDLFDNVRLLDIDRPGKVTGISIDRFGTQYRVAFWHDSARRSEWVDVDELEPLPPKLT